jgi:hypothetical protein
MPSLVFRLWVLLLTVLLQVGSWRAEASLHTSSMAVASGETGPRGPSHRDVGDVDAAEDSSEELSAVDDSLGADVVIGSVPGWVSAAESARWRPSVSGLPPGGPPLETPFKPPRA